MINSLLGSRTTKPLDYDYCDYYYYWHALRSEWPFIIIIITIYR